MNVTSFDDGNLINDIQFGNKGAVLFIVAYIGFYGLSIICLFGQQLKETQKQRHELPAYFLKTLWDVPNKNKLYRSYRDPFLSLKFKYCLFRRTIGRGTPETDIQCVFC